MLLDGGIEFRGVIERRCFNRHPLMRMHESAVASPLPFTWAGPM